ncbi:F-box/LRR-repeat protein At3g03360-like [Silene latifolia]|uniref:F-box/LRR-repeat protein At3g03360-like n=1 Tax=Silene latifolia TaxID=37657 RepID=UPI003D7861A5
MNPDCEETIPGQLNTVDRLSDLPDFILHDIISYLGTREAYRTCILSKRWAHISGTNPIIEFHYYCKKVNSSARYWPSKKVSARLLEYMDTRMQRYDKDKLRVRTLSFRFPDYIYLLDSNIKKLELSSKVDEWIRIAVRNQVAKLDLDVPNINYQLPAILLSAKSLRELYCMNVKIPYYNGAINLASLQTLELLYVGVEERMLNHIISSCLLLKCLSVKFCFGFKTIVIPCCSQVKELTLKYSLPKNGTIILESSYLTCFQFSDSYDDRWPIMLKPGLLRNLRTLDLFSSGITDGDLGKLLPELASLETLHLFHCRRLTMIRISNVQLKKIYLDDCHGLLYVTIDAPSLTKFKYKGDFDPDCIITISSQASCLLSVHTIPYCLDTPGFFKLKQLMTGLRSCNALKIWLSDDYDESGPDDIKFDEEELGDVNLGPPRDIRELKLSLYDQNLSRSSVSAFLNGLFWTCRPDIISFQFFFHEPDLMIQLFMSELEDMANCWGHPLKRIESPDANCSNTLESKKVDLQLRLHW